MEIRINIECDTINEFYAHLTCLRAQIKKECKKLKLDPLRDEFQACTELYDDNCYGTHSAIIDAPRTCPA